LLRGRRRLGRVIDQEARMKLSVLISSAVAVVIAAVAMSSSASGSPGVRNVAGFRSPSGNIHCYYDSKAYAPNGSQPLLTCGLRHANYAMRLQRRCLAGDWHGFGLRSNAKPTLFCSGNPNFSIHPVYTTLAYGKSWTRGQFTCISRITGTTCRNAGGHGLFISRQSYRTW
ncbi:MAG TPA: DUF6636 domain-containing protein, partial [Gaiellaceae bacterium]|nr:DUF6636 domain-containing protein [Gaiellaceae bacterium]